MSGPLSLMIRLIQCLCEHRHCIVATAYNPADLDSETMMRGFKALVVKAVESKTLNPWCGICDSRAWHYEDGETIYETIEDAMTSLRIEEAKQAKLAQLLRESRN